MSFVCVYLRKLCKPPVPIFHLFSIFFLKGMDCNVLTKCKISRITGNARVSLNKHFIILHAWNLWNGKTGINKTLFGTSFLYLFFFPS